jgi:uncharacterized SAM-binding protein YcdF (DUF218 family)
MKKRPFRFSKPKLVISLPLLVFGVLVISILYEPILLAIGDFLVIQDELHPADVIHVIAGEDYRTEYAIQLYKQGYGKTLFFTGGWCKYHDYYHGKHAQELALSQGVPLEAIAYDESTVTSTYSEAERLKAWIVSSPTPVRLVIVVSDPFHMRRARWAYRKVLGDDIEVQMAPVPMELALYQRAWWKDKGSQGYIRDEYQKYLYYILRYQFSWGQFKEWLTSLDTE